MFGLKTFTLEGFTELQYMPVITACLYSEFTFKLSCTLSVGERITVGQIEDATLFGVKGLVITMCLGQIYTFVTFNTKSSLSGEALSALT